MYKKFFGLNESPFNMTPDPKFLYFSDKHSEALTQLLYGINGRKGFLVVTGEIGAGKTTLCRALLNELDEKIRSALILNSNLTELELLQAINEDLGIPCNFDNKKELIGELNKFLLHELEEDENVVIIIDEAQNLTPAVLEQIRLLSNLETTKEKLLQIVLIGQPELRDILDLDELKQLNQRISIRYHINPLNRKETEDYINHRLVIAGSKGDINFSAGSLNRLFKYSGGIPRLINVVCDKALLAGYVLETKVLTRQMVDKSISEIEGENTFKKRKKTISKEKGKSAGINKGLIAACFVLIFLLASVWIIANRAPQFLANNSNKEEKLVSNQDKNKENPVLNNKALKEDKINEDAISENMDSNSGSAGEKNFYFDDNEVLRSQDRAFSSITSLITILKLWDVNVEIDTLYEKWKDHTGYFSFWSEAAKYDIQATFVRLDFDRLRALNLPCILQVQDDDFKNLEYVVFLGYSDDSLLIGNCTEGIRKLTESELNMVWNGVSILIWKNIYNLTRELREGMSGEDVKKVEEIFRKLGYFKGIPPTDYFSAITTNVIKHFQNSSGILVDGIVGPETKIALYSRIENSGYPKLFIE